MVTKLSATDMAYLFSILIGIVVSGILFFNERLKAYCVRWLALSYVMICLTFFVIFLYRTHLIEQFPHLYRTGSIFMLLYMPLSFLFVRASLWQKPATKWDWLHVIPVLIYIADFSSLFLSSADTKLSILSQDFNRAIFNFSYGKFFFRRVLQGIPFIDSACLLDCPGCLIDTLDLKKWNCCSLCKWSANKMAVVLSCLPGYVVVPSFVIFSDWPGSSIFWDIFCFYGYVQRFHCFFTFCTPRHDFHDHPRIRFSHVSKSYATWCSYEIAVRIAFRCIRPFNRYRC